MKNKLVNIFLLLRGDRILHFFNRTPRVLFYHGVDCIKDATIEPESFDIENFTKQIKYLSKHYEIISIKEFENRLNKNSFSNKEVVLTFDDGYVNNLKIVAPILTERKLPFTVFISTRHIDTGQLFPTSIARIILFGAQLKKVSIPCLNKGFMIETEEQTILAYKEISDFLKTEPVNVVYEICNDLISNVSYSEWNKLKEKYNSTRPMNWEQVIELSKVATIGAHCDYHICCHSGQNIHEVEGQIIRSKKKIKEKLGVDCLYFAYPNGDYTELSNKIVAKHFNLGFSTKRKERLKININRAIIPRIGAISNANKFKVFLNLNPKK